ncbi:MAG TPA: YqgE/AlgH family protein [Actinotalea sp.]|jgi:putative transcriptional regulator
MTQHLTGQLLVATPGLLDPNFRRSVVLVLHHDDEGALGVVLDRPLDVDVGSVLGPWQDVVSPPAALFQGGPVGLDGALAVAIMRTDAEPHPTVTRVAGIFALVDLDADPAEAEQAFTGVRVFAGHAGWGDGQLDEEVAAGGWYVLPALADDVVTPDPSSLWRRVLRRQGGALAIVSTYPENPLLN